MASLTRGNPIDTGQKKQVDPKPNTRQETRRTGTLIATESVEEIKSAEGARRYLEKGLYLCPQGEPITPTSLKYCLHQISKMPGITVPIGKAVRAAALLVEEFEEYAIAETIRETVNTQLSSLTEDFQLMATNIKEQIDERIGERLTDLDKYTTRMDKVIKKMETNNVPPPQNTTHSAHPDRPHGHRSYAETLISPPRHVDPRLAAKEGIRARQFMLEGVTKDSKHGEMNNAQLKTDFSGILRELGLEGKGIRAVNRQRLGGLLIEMESDHATAWLRGEDNAKEFCGKVGPDAKFRTRTYNLIAYNVPITLDPQNEKHLEEIHEVNQIEKESITKARWVKPIARRSPNQRSAHLILTFTDINTANRALTNGLLICHSKVKVDKVKKEPIRCLKCQRWNHYAKDCPAEEDTCSNCAGPHRSSQCPNPLKRRCVSCNTDEHASWSRECPTFLKKIDDCNSKHPENALPLIPSDEPWTWNRGESRLDYNTRFNAREFYTKWDFEPPNGRRSPNPPNPTATKSLNWADSNYNDDFYV